MVSASSPGHPANTLSRRFRTPNAPIPLLTRLKARNLYFASTQHSEIASQCGIPLRAVTQLISREGWPKQRAERFARLQASADRKLSRQLDGVEETMVSEVEEIALSALKNTRDSLSAYNARDFQAYTAGVRNLVSVSRAIKQQDGGNASQDTGASPMIVLLRCGSAPDERPVLNVTPPPPGGTPDRMA